MKSIQNLLNFSLINIDKPSGPTSFSVSEYVKKSLKLKKTSHMGTLDPKVTGVLPITLGRACKLASYFIRHDKGYVGILQTHNVQKMEELQKLIDSHFLGKIKQTPPHRSAVKREEREREVYKFEFLESGSDGKSFLFHCVVEGGTYIRKICSDLGEMIGGAHMAELRRVSAGIFDEKTLISLYDFDRAVEEYNSGSDESLRKMLVPAEDAIKEVLPFLQIEKRVLKALSSGKPLFQKDIVGKVPKFKIGDSFAVFLDSQFVGVYKRTDEQVIFGRPEFVYN